MIGELIPIFGIIATAMVLLALILRKDGRAGDNAEKERLERENAELRETVTRVEERLAVLERIATDPADRTLREIEKLR